MNISHLPSAELIEAGLRDLASGLSSTESLLVLVGAPRLTRNGIAVPRSEVTDPERELYETLQRQYGDGAHSKYNALIRGLVSFERAMECASR